MLAWHDAADQPGRQRVPGIDEPTREDHVHRDDFAYSARQPLRAARAGHDTDVDLGLADLHVVAGDDDIAHHHEFTPTAEREARHGRDDRLLDALDAIPRGELIALVHADRRLLG